MSRIVIAAVGSYGDLFPLIAVADELRSRGHRITFICPSNYEQHIINRDYECISYKFSYIEYLSRLPSYINGVKWLESTVGEQFKLTYSNCLNADMIVGSMYQLAAPSIAEAMAIPYFYAAFSPIVFRSDCNLIQRLSACSLPHCVHRFTRYLRDQSINKILKRTINSYRSRLGLRSINDVFQYAVYSDQIFAAFDAELFQENNHFDGAVLTGSWRAKEAANPIGSLLEDFLLEGDSPIYLGFGSSSFHKHSPSVDDLIYYATSRNERFLIQDSFFSRSPYRVSGNVIVVGYMPHSQLFPHVKCAVHHGGMGTTTSAAFAGVPQILIPHMGDQFYTSSIIYSIGLGPAPIQLRSALNRHLSEALQELSRNSGFFIKAKEIGNRLNSSDDGASCAANCMERILRKRELSYE